MEKPNNYFNEKFKPVFDRKKELAGAQVKLVTELAYSGSYSVINEGNQSIAEFWMKLLDPKKRIYNIPTIQVKTNLATICIRPEESKRNIYLKTAYKKRNLVDPDKTNIIDPSYLKKKNGFIWTALDEEIIATAYKHMFSQMHGNPQAKLLEHKLDVMKSLRECLFESHMLIPQLLPHERKVREPKEQLELCF